MYSDFMIEALPTYSTIHFNEKHAAATKWCLSLQYFGIRINNVCVCVESSLSSGESCQHAGNTVTVVFAS